MNDYLQNSSSVSQFSRSVVSDSVTPWTAARQAFLSITNSRSSLRLTSIESVMPSSHLILCSPLLLCPQSLPASESFPMSQLRYQEIHCESFWHYYNQNLILFHTSKFEKFWNIGQFLENYIKTYTRRNKLEQSYNVLDKWNHNKIIS